MAKLFSGLTLIVALVATFLGFQSKELVEKLRTAADRDHTELVDKRAKLIKTEKELAATKDELAATKDELGKAKDALVKAEEKQKAAEAELAAATKALTEKETQLATLKKSYDDLKVAFGDKTPEEIAKEIDAMKTKRAELETKVAAMEKDGAEQKTVIETLTRNKQESEEKLVSQKKVIDRYKNNIVQQGLRGEVLAVNAGWGFCVLSIGDRQGAAANKIMIVVRNGQAIGKVKIINVEVSQSVADIIPSSFTRGAYVRPGDEVIYTGEDKVREEPAAAGGTAPAPANPPSGLPLPQ